MTVIYNTNYTHNPNAYLTLSVGRAAKALWGEENVVVADNMNLLPIAASGEHEVLICIDGQRSDVELLKRLRPSFKTMILWTFEDPFLLEFDINISIYFDYVFTNDPACVPFYKTNSHYLPLGGSESIHYREVKESDNLDYDIFFAGTMWPNRVGVLRRIIASFPHARMKLICPCNEYLPPLPNDLLEHVIRRPISMEAFVDFANASAVTLTLFRNYASHGTVGQATAPGPRLYELALAGTAQVVELPSEMDERYLKELNGIGIARSAEEIAHQIATILDDKLLRKRLASAAQTSVMEGHLYKNRLQKIEEITKANFKKNQKITSGGEILSPARVGKLRVLFVTHSTIHEHVWGGVEVYQQILCASLGRHVEFYYWLRRRGACTLTDNNGNEIERFDMPNVGWLDSMNDAQEESAFSSIICQYDIDVVHIQHLGHHTLSLPAIAKACGVGVVYSFHDFITVCSHYNLLNYEQRYCHIEDKTVSACDICLKISENLEFGVQETRRSFIASTLKSVDVCLFGSDHSQQVNHKIYPLLKQKDNYVIGIPSLESGLPIKKKQYEPLNGRPLCVATVGNFIRSKGADSIICIIQSANPQLYEFHIFGYMQPEYEDVLKNLGQDNVILHGSYTPGEISSLSVADAVLILSIWPETYCISLSEVWQNGLIPVATDIGALGDRIVDGVNGFKLPVGEASNVIERLELIRSDEKLRQQIMENITPDLWVNNDEYVEKLLDIYKQVTPRREMGQSNLQWDIGRLHYLPHDSWKKQAPPRHIFDAPLENKLHVELPQHVDSWINIQGASCYVDDICYHILNVDDEANFNGADEFHIRGWFVFPEVSGAGTLYTVLIHQDSNLTIFLECDRENREDVAKSFANAPMRNGFAGQSALRGKWCEGIFRVGLINIVHSSGAFQLTNNEIEIKDSRVVSIRTVNHENQVILDDFARITEKDGLLRGIRLNSFIEKELYPQRSGELEFYLDRFSGIIDDDSDEFEESQDVISISGWAYNRAQALAGQIYVAFVSSNVDKTFLFGTSRFVRLETLSVYQGAPLCNGFKGRLCLQEGYHVHLNGEYHVCLVNVTQKDYKVGVTNIRVSIDENGNIETEEVPLSDKITSHCHAIIDQKAAQGTIWKESIKAYA